MAINNSKNNSSFNNSKYKVYNIFTIQEASDVLRGEFNKSESLVDRTLHIPTLQEYIKEYVLTGHCSAPYNNLEQFDGDDDANVDFSPQDFRDADIDDVKDYLDSLKNRIKEIENQEKTKKKSNPPKTNETKNATAEPIQEPKQ